MSATGNYGGASSMGGGGNMNYREVRGSGGLLGDSGLSGLQVPNGENEKLEAFLRALGIDPSTLNGGAGWNNGNGGNGGNNVDALGRRRRPEPPPAAWKFPQYTQSWLPSPPPVPPRVPTPPFVR